jgi:hypothetical protein
MYIETSLSILITKHMSQYSVCAQQQNNTVWKRSDGSGHMIPSFRKNKNRICKRHITNLEYWNLILRDIGICLKLQESQHFP